MAAPGARMEDSGAQLASDSGRQSDADSAGASGSGAAAAATAGFKAEEKPLPALFLDSMPEDSDAHPDLAGLNTMMGELTAEECAENEKRQGNDALKQGLAIRKKFYLRKAVEHYTAGIAIGVSDVVLNSVLHANRAQAELKLGNSRNAMRDALRAVQLDPENKKAYFRAAKAALEIKDYEQARTVCQQGLQKQPEFPELAGILKDVEAKEAAALRQHRQVLAERQAARAPAKALAATLLSCGWRIGQPEISIGTRKPQLDANGVVWPAMLIYPESMQNDAIEAFHEHHVLSDHLDAMFGRSGGGGSPSRGNSSPLPPTAGPEAPPLVWDTEQQYMRSRLQVYYLSHSGKPISEEQLTEYLHGGWPEGLPKDKGPERYGSKRSEWIEVDQGQTLGEILSRPDYVVPGIPVFFVVAKGSKFAERFLSEDAYRP